jgi:hypothetical protein
VCYVGEFASLRGHETETGFAKRSREGRSCENPHSPGPIGPQDRGSKKNVAKSIMLAPSADGAALRSPEKETRNRRATGKKLREAGYERIGPPGVAFARWGGVTAVL